MELSKIQVILLFVGVFIGSVLIANGVHHDNLIVGVFGSIVLAFSYGTLTVTGFHNEEKRWK